MERLKRDKDAITDYTHAIRENRHAVTKKDLPSAYSARAHCFHRLGNHGEAAGDFARAIALAPSADLHYWHANALHFDGKYKQAIAAYSAAIKLDPKHGKAYRGRGNSKRAASGFFEKDDAARDWARARALGVKRH